MAKRLTVFYSWQSDTPASTNRSFIEKALNEALKRLHSDATLESALRDTQIELDKDTKGVPGSPPIVETILHKIEECAVFVADLTFVAHSLEGLTNAAGKPRLVPNPNVLVEYGFALRCHSHAAVVGVMNIAFGSPSAETLPFDLRHLRWPLTYHLPQDSKSDQNATELKKLVASFAEALRLILAKRQPSQPLAPVFVPQKTTKNAAVFHEDINDLIPDDRWSPKPGSFVLPDGGKMFLRVYPIEAVPAFPTELDAEEALRKSTLHPFGDVRGYSTGRNTFGAIVYEAPNPDELFHFTQLFMNREIWCVDALELNADVNRQWFARTGYQGQPEFIPIERVQTKFVLMLENILSAAKAHLNLPFPLIIEAGLVGIKGYVAAINERFVGKALRDVQWKSQVDDGKPAWEMLGPFFDHLWAVCGLRRTPDWHAKLVKQFSERH